MKNIIISSLIVSLLGATSYNNDLHTSENQPYSKFKSTFIQNWYCREWTQERWEQEFYEMKSAGFDSVIIQSVCDISRGECAENKNNQDIDSYPDYLTFSMFPTDLQKNISYSSQNNGDALELALEAAKSTGVKIWLGTVNDDMWWKYGWGVPKGNYFEKWSMENAVLCSELIREMWERYGEDYEEQIAGWYYVNEIWNMDSACKGTDGGEYARIIGENINLCIEAVNDTCYEKPVMFSPFYNADISTPQEYTMFLSDIIDESDFRSFDIYAGQDGGGRGYDSEIIRKWALAQKNAVDSEMTYMVNTECFNEDYTAKSIDELNKNYRAVSDICQGNILFSWNHYYANDQLLNEQFQEFTYDFIKGDINDDGRNDVSDLLLMKNYLLGITDVFIKNVLAGDLSENGVTDISDLCLLKYILLQ